MQEKLIIYLHARDLTHPSWVVFNAKFDILQDAQHGDTSDLSSLAVNKDVTVIVPGEDVLLTTIALPKMSQTRLMQAIPFALEEQLIDDVETLHFVPGPSHIEGQFTVSVVAKEKMQEWLTLLQSWQIQPDVMMPATLTLPKHHDNTWCVAVDDVSLVRMGDYQGFACDKTNLNDMLTIALSSAEIKPSSIEVYNGATFLKINQPVNLKETILSPEQLQLELAKQAVQFPLMNLLSGAYKRKKVSYSQQRNTWNYIFYLIMLWVLLLISYPMISYFIMHQRLADLNAKIFEIYKRHFPNATSVVAPEMRLEEKQRSISSQAGDNKPLLLMSYLGKGMRQVSGIQLKRLDYQNDHLNVELTAASSDEFAQFTEFLQREGLQVKQQSANVSGARVNATIVIQ